jgi:hypothetical protein
MNNYRKINNWTGWAVFAIATIVYVLTMEKSGSLWDCGEYASTAHRMGIPHPPGAPLFVMIGRMFSFVGHDIFGFNAITSITFSSALCSALTILFLFWTITHFARKSVMRKGGELDNQNIISIMAAGVVGALAYTFSDSFWFSAVEPEVYAMSSLCTAVVFWAALKWEDHPGNTNEPGNAAGRSQADKWMILIFFIMGMSIGVHLLNLLTIPAIVLIYYFKRYKTTTQGLLLALFTSVMILGFVQKIVGQYSISFGFEFEKLFVNSFHLPVLVGFVFAFIIIGAVLFLGLRIAHQQKWPILRLSLWCLSFLFVGMSTYMTTMIRAKANPGVDMYNVDNPYALKGYLGREQYGDFPLLFGQHYESNTKQDGGTITGNKYVLRKVYSDENDTKGTLQYVKAGVDREVNYVSGDKMLFPRMWEGNDPNHKNFYRAWLGPKSEVLEQEFEQGAEGGYALANQSVYSIENDENTARNIADKQNELAQKNGRPVRYAVRDHVTYGMNMRWLMEYQFNWMYVRYFMWNFAGKQNDNQGMSGYRDGNWISGISFIDNWRLGSQDKMPDSLKNNKAHNKLYFLPFILGLIGLFYQLRYQRKDWFVNGLLFLMTGLAIVFYLNQYGPQPRERDYAYVGSFYAFAIWIGMGVLQVKEWFNKLTSRNIANIAAAGLCMVAVPLLMARVEWDDHDRSKKTVAPDLAKDYLESCPKNAILFTIGDNDTYPLWFAQEVEGVRKDVRVVNTSLLGIDWYLDQLRYKVNESAPFKMVWKSTDYEGGKMEYGDEKAYPGFSADTRFPLDTLLLLALKQDEDLGRDMTRYHYPGKNYYVQVDQEKASKIFKYAPGDSAVTRMNMSIGGGRGYLTKGDFGILNIIAANISERPICFTDQNGDIQSLGISPYLRREAMVYRLIPAEKLKMVETDSSTVLLMNRFAYGNAKTKGVYYDEENRRHLQSIRDVYVETATALVQEGRKDEAKAMLRKIHTQMPSYSLPYGMPSRGGFNNSSSLQMTEAAFMAGDTSLAKEVFTEVSKDIMQEMRYYHGLANPGTASNEKEVAAFIKMFEDMQAAENKLRGYYGRGLTKEEDEEAKKLQAQIENYRAQLFKNKLNGSFNMQDFYGSVRTYEQMMQVKQRYIDAPLPPPVDPNIELPQMPIQNTPPQPVKAPAAPPAKKPGK